MRSLAVLLLFGALIGFSACMSVVEYEEDNDVKENELGWFFAVHFHFGDVAEEKNGVLGCTGNPCYLCKKSSFDVNLHKNMATAAYKYNGCVIITKTPDNKYMVGVTIDDELQYANAFEINENVNLPCIYPDESNPDGKICPHIYNVDLENGKMCASLDEYLHIMDTNMRHENNLGCAEIY